MASTNFVEEREKCVRYKIICGDVLEKLKSLPDKTFQCVVTSPPYWGLRDYGVAGQLGLEKTPEEYVAKMVEVFREVRRVLRDDGTCWVNLGDSYATQGGPVKTEWKEKMGTSKAMIKASKWGEKSRSMDRYNNLKQKDLCGIPWRVAFALQADGWYLRSDIIWHKPNPMPESVTDRPTKSHEYIFLLTKFASYYYDAEAIKEPYTEPMNRWGGDKLEAKGKSTWDKGTGQQTYRDRNMRPDPHGRNKRTVWTIATQPYKGAHFAVFPMKLVEPCILAGTSEMGCCPKCGNPLERIVESEPATSKSCPKTKAAHHARGGTGDPIGTVGKSGSGRIDGYTKTIGWQPSCDCNSGEPVPCIVLDPFSGAGTVGVVCKKHGRNFYGIDLNTAYCEMARDRIEKSLVVV